MVNLYTGAIETCGKNFEKSLKKQLKGKLKGKLQSNWQKKKKKKSCNPVHIQSQLKKVCNGQGKMSEEMKEGDEDRERKKKRKESIV